MSFINMNLGGVVEPKPVPKGSYDLTITTQQDHTNESSGKKSVRCSVGIQGHEDAPNILHFLSLPSPDDKPESSAYKMLLIKRFLTAFNIPFEDSGFNQEDLVGATAHLELDLETGEDNVTRNTIVLPKIKDEDAVTGPISTARKTA